MLLLATTVWLLVDAAVTRGSAAAQIGARLTIVASLFIAVQAAAEVAAPSALEALVAGEPAPLVELIEVMQAVGWPTLAAGWILLAVGCGHRLAPRPVVALNVAGAGRARRWRHPRRRPSAPSLPRRSSSSAASR
jgi:hypothetical protein